MWIKMDMTAPYGENPIPKGLRRLCDKYGIDSEACMQRNKKPGPARSNIWDLGVFVRLYQAVMAALHEDTSREFDESYIGHRPAGYKPQSKWFGLDAANCNDSVTYCLLSLCVSSLTLYTMSRVMRSGRTYDPGQAPAAPKRRARRSASTKQEGASENNGEIKSEPEPKLITFGTIPGTETLEGSLVLDGTGKRRGVSWTKSGGVKLSPAAYKALTNKAPPIRPTTRLRIVYPTYTREVVDARIDTDAPTDDNREDAPTLTTVRAADRALGAVDAPDAADCAPEGSGRTVYVTARTSRVLDSDDNEEESAQGAPQYVVANDSPSNERVSKRSRMKEVLENDDQSEPAGISWFEESRKADNAPDGSELPELDEEWYRDHRSRSQDLSAPGSEADTNRLDETESVSVNVLIYEVDENDVLTDD
ncbi:hypothetical protein BN14_06229 [Rhizoctonia solani AG-1 IB]|uniref:Uncharacterized protein n=1 Tax=Thanatephorus cucumeris (strain AG1-IB / isolate 7/3/14) TaxID=1108050 RepID=M5BZV3_THACB|nr:hypothetical protein BN14_06229 [Rhizoctonia solani AG-1 IB]